VHLTLGTRLERNDYTGTEVLPNARLAWKPAPEHLLWAAASRAVRSPSRLDRDVYVPVNPPYTLGGGPQFESEVAKVYEAGYRGQPSRDVSWSVTAFHADYSRLRTLEFDTSGAAVVSYGNGMRGQTSGVETWGSWQVMSKLRLSAAYTRFSKRLALEPGSSDLDGALATEGSDPKHRWSLRASTDLPHQTTFDATIRHVSALSRPQVAAYTVVDLRAGWQVRPGLELSLTAQNLFSPAHSEYEYVAPYRSEYGRSVFLKVTSRF
jgi:iron complex outermembrane receptor protein